MPLDKRTGSKIANWTNQDKVMGTTRDSGPYIGIIKNNADPIRAGRLQCYVPDFGGVETDPGHWITVSYANPYMGAARIPSVEHDKPTDNTYTQVNHSYGMWFTPPDIGNQVLITFVNGDVNRGYWFACIMPDLSHWAIPGQAGAQNLETPLDTNLAQALTNPPYPAVEFNETNQTLQQKWSNFLQINKPIHEEQVKVLLKQGLEDDKIRGVISSSSQRESPSKVFGISTPGADGSMVDPQTGQVTYRKGGHTFVMDDGNSEQQADPLIRLRTAGGHQILMKDSDSNKEKTSPSVLYIGNSEGSVWMEFDEDGKVYFYSKSDINIRTEGNFNLHSDKDINMNANGNINMRAGNMFKQQAATINLNANTDLEMYGQKVGLGSGSTLNISAATDGGFLAGANLTFFGNMLYLNTNSPPSVPQPTSIPTHSYPEVVPKSFGPYTKWQATGSASSIMPSAIPTHEPFTHSSGKGLSNGSITATHGSSTPLPVTNTTIENSVQLQPGPTVIAPAAGIDPVKMLRPDNPALALHPIEPTGMGILTADQLTALKAQIANAESNFNYHAVNNLYYMGKYQFGYQTLITFGYAKPTVTSNYQLLSDNTQQYWTGKDGIINSTQWLNLPAIQEKVMNMLLQQNYTYLLSHADLNDNPVIDNNSKPTDVAGKLAICHLLGGQACVKWTNGEHIGTDANGTSGTTYYNLGSYAIQTIAPHIATMQS